MIEATPKSIRPPQAEDLIRVGVVLKDDHRTRLDLHGLRGLTLRAGQAQMESTEDGLTLHVRDGNIVCSNTAGTEIISGPTLHIASPDTQSIEAGKGIQIDAVAAGRGFHWQKEISQCFAGDFEVSLADGFLVAVNILPFENYLACVGSSEMSSDCPAEFAKAQITAARSWTRVFLGDKHPGEPFSVCNDDDCQRYQGTTHLRAEFLTQVRDCRGEFLLTTSGVVCPAYYAKSCGGMTENPQAIFGFPVSGIKALADATPAQFADCDLSSEPAFEKWLSLKSDDCGSIYCSSISVPENSLKKYIGAVDEAGKYFRWEYTLAAETLLENLKHKFELKDVATIRNISPIKRSISGRLTELRIQYLNTKGAEAEFLLSNQYDIRRALHPSFLFSSAFIHEAEKDAAGSISRIKLRGAGWGHGVGLCQIGALGMALKGADSHAILRHYYPDTSVFKAY